MKSRQLLSRRDFLKVCALGMGTLAFRSWRQIAGAPSFPEADRLGRVVAGKVDVKARPHADSETVAALFEDQVVPWIRELIGSNPYRINQRWVETPDGYVWSPYVQPVRNEPNDPLDRLPETSLGHGMWMEVTVPYVDIILANPPARAPWLQGSLEYGFPPRFYYSQVFWVDEIKVDENGDTWYRVNERYGFGDIFWVSANGLRPITQEETEPIRPEIEEKRVVVDVSRQTMSCLEGNREVYFSRVSTGAKFDANGNAVDEWATPLGAHRTWRKMVSTHMVGGTTGGGYDLPGIGWTSLFVGTGVAIHSTFWHNDFGVPRSHGCVNAKPADAKWVFRWINPIVPYDPGDVTVSMPGGTTIEVVET